MAKESRNARHKRRTKMNLSRARRMLQQAYGQVRALTQQQFQQNVMLYAILAHQPDRSFTITDGTIEQVLKEMAGLKVATSRSVENPGETVVRLETITAETSARIEWTDASAPAPDEAYERPSGGLTIRKVEDEVKSDPYDGIDDDPDHHAVAQMHDEGNPNHVDVEA